MYGHGTAPPQPRPASRGAAIGLRVLFAVLPVVTLGVGAWGSVLRLALVLRRPLDWVLMPVTGVVAVAGFVMVGTARDTSSPQSNAGAACLLVCMVATPVYFLIADIRGAAPGTRPRAAVRPPNPYVYDYVPGPIPGAAAPGAPGAPAGPPGGHGHGYGRPGYDPVPGAAPPSVAPRIDQVRAELDELSDYLRKEEGR